MVLHREVSMTYLDNPQHWHASQPYAGGDHLLTALRRGWEVTGTVEMKRHSVGGLRAVNLATFTLVRDDETMLMPVLSNPFVHRFLIRHELETVEETIA